MGGYIKVALRAARGAPFLPCTRRFLQSSLPVDISCGENDRAAYGKQVLQYISQRMTAEFGKGFTIRNLRYMRQFYLTFPNGNALRSELSWSHYRSLMKVPDAKARAFYLEECAKAGWSSRQLERQINTMFYQRLLASRDKESVAAEIQVTEPKPEYEQIIKDPYVLEFLDLPVNEHFYESNLEQALIDHLQKFLLELGRGFSFVARQKHFHVDVDQFRRMLIQEHMEAGDYAGAERLCRERIEERAPDPQSYDYEWQELLYEIYQDWGQRE